MKGEEEIKSGNLTKKDESVIRKDVAVFAFFLFLSFVFWYLNSLGKDIEAEIRYPVKYTNLPKERVIVEESPVKLTLYLKGTGYSIFKLKLSGKRIPLIIDISKVTYKRAQGRTTPDFFILTSGLTKSFTVQLRSVYEITSIKPDTIFFTLDKVGVKINPVAPENRAADSKIK